ncbi:MAG: protein kinase domain-containing protein, partial [Planctomycetota bacterium]
MYVDLSKNELICKIVYFGPGLSGKTTNLDYLQQNAPSQRTTDLVHVDRDGERTLAFSLYPDHPPEASGMQIRVDLLTVPGRAYYITNRRDILDGADGIVFIADSRREAIDENIDAMNDMWSFINHNKLARDIPIVIQFNKQDLESAIPREQLDPLMNSQNHPAFSGIATTGEGVIETMQAILEQALPRITDPERITAEIEHAQTMGGSSEPRQHIVSSAFHLGEEEEETWLLTCYHCDAVLEVVDVHKGDLFACGSCNSMLEVMDPNTGETRPAPDPTTPLRNTAATTPTTPHSKTPVLPSSIDPTPSSGPNALAELPQLPGLDVRDQVDACLLGIRYHAVQSSDGRAMRVLVLDPVLLRQPGYSDTIEPHARRARAIRHNHILPCLDLQHWGSTPFFVSEQPEGYEPLDLLLARRRKLAPPQAMGIIRQLAQALEEAERHDVHHGWIRPEVILINEAGQILLDELAVAKHPAYILRESMGGSASTEYYLAPEHLQPDVMPDSRTDIFMLGALLFRMICGEGLVTGYTAHEALHKVITNGPRHLRDANPDISRELDNFSMRLVSVDRKDRLQRHSDLLATLENFGGGAHRGTMRINRKPTVASVSARNSMAGSAMGPHVTGVPRGMQGRTTTGANRPPPRTATAPSGSSKRQRKPTFGPLLLVALLALLATLVYFQREEIRAWQRHETPASTPPTQPAPIVIPKAESEPAQELIAKAKAQLTAVEADPGDVDARQALLALLADMRRAPVQELRDAAATLRIRLDHIPVPESEPTPEPTQPEATPTAQQKREAEVAELQQRIRKLLPQGRYGEASSLVGQLPDEQLRRTMMESIRQLHTQARQALRKQALAVSDEAALATILATAERWRMPDDADWLQALRQEAQAALQQDETDAASAQVDDGRPPLATLNGIPIDIIIADMQIDAALKQRDFTRANAIANNLPSDDPRALALALAHKVELAQQAQQVMATALEQHTGPFRVATPFGEQRWDVTDITDGGLEVRSPSDEKLSFG